MNFIKSVFILALVATLFSACTKESEVGANLLLDEDFPNATFSDTFKVEFDTKYEDTVSTSSLKNIIIGSTQDPYFGNAYTSMFGQVRLPSNNMDLRGSNGFVIDSVVLQMPYYITDRTLNYYGDKTKEIRVKVFQLIDSLRSTNYQSNVQIQYNPIAIGEETFTGSVDSVLINANPVYAEKLAPMLRIELGNQTGLIDSLRNQLPNTGFKDNTTFLKLLKGLAIVPVDTANRENFGCMYTFDVRHAQSGLMVYYRKINATGEEKTKVLLPFNTNSVITASYKHNYAGAIAQTYIQNNSANDSLVFLQGLAGVNTKVSFPTLKNLGRNVVINKAELKIYQAKSNLLDVDNVFTVPKSIGVVITDTMGRFVLTDEIAFSQALRGGSPVTESINGVTYNVYKLNLTIFLQKILMNQQPGDNIHLIVVNKSNNPQRLVFKGGNANMLPAKLRLFYTKG